MRGPAARGAAWLRQREAGIAAVLLLTILAVTAINPSFLSALNVSNTLTFTVELGLIALAMTLLMTAGEFDLSVGSVFGFAPVLMWTLFNGGIAPLEVSFLVGMLAAVGIGLAMWQRSRPDVRVAAQTQEVTANDPPLDGNQQDIGADVPATESTSTPDSRPAQETSVANGESKPSDEPPSQSPPPTPEPAKSANSASPSSPESTEPPPPKSPTIASVSTPPPVRAASTRSTSSLRSERIVWISRLRSANIAATSPVRAVSIDSTS